MVPLNLLPLLGAGVTDWQMEYKKTEIGKKCKIDMGLILVDCYEHQMQPQEVPGTSDCMHICMAGANLPYPKNNLLVIENK